MPRPKIFKGPPAQITVLVQPKVKRRLKQICINRGDGTNVSDLVRPALDEIIQKERRKEEVAAG